VICTNPIAAATPQVDGLTAFAMDMAQSVGSFGKIRFHEREGTPIPEGWALDREGRPTTVPTEATRGALLPFGGAKGSALALLVEVLAGVLPGAGYGTRVGSPARGDKRAADVGHLFIAIDVGAFMPLGDFAGRVDDLARIVTGARPAEGFERVRFPGQGASRRREAVDAHGIEMPLSSIAAIAAALEKLSIPMVSVRG
jgi:LDH2 family malate/lactate/ureidoglycolate dehydrogenase